MKRKQQNPPPSLAKPGHRSVLCGSLLCWISEYWRSRHKTMHHTSKGERRGKCVLCSLKAVSCVGQNRYLFCTLKQMIFYSLFCWARLLISTSMKKEEKMEKNYFTRHIVITVVGIAVMPLSGVQFLARAALPSSDPNLLKQPVVWTGSSDQSGWQEWDCSRTVRSVILSNTVCDSYELMNQKHLAHFHRQQELSLQITLMSFRHLCCLWSKCSVWRLLKDRVLLQFPAANL